MLASSIVLYCGSLIQSQTAIEGITISGVNVVGIGTGGESKLYTACFEHDEITRTVLNFIRAYVNIAQADL